MFPLSYEINVVAVCKHRRVAKISSSFIFFFLKRVFGPFQNVLISLITFFSFNVVKFGVKGSQFVSFDLIKRDRVDKLERFEIRVG